MRVNRLVDEGGDWDRRNRLKVYRGVHFLSIRNFKKGAELLLDALPTFTASELIDYDDFVVLCVLAGVFALERKDLKKKVRQPSPAGVRLSDAVLSRFCGPAELVLSCQLYASQVIDAPEVIAVVPTVPTIKGFAESLHKSDYAAFFKALGALHTLSFSLSVFGLPVCRSADVRRCCYAQPPSRNTTSCLPASSRSTPSTTRANSASRRTRNYSRVTGASRWTTSVPRSASRASGSMRELPGILDPFSLSWSRVFSVN